VGVRTGFWLSRPSLLKSLWTHVRLAVRLFREPQVPLLLKVLPALVALYVLSPIDFLPDVVPLLGQFDDLTIIAIGLETFVRIAPSGPAQFHRDALAQRRPYSPMPPTATVIDVEFHHS
jgi:uncharacterized membrane protein YkvA (DUF1232 family)